MKLGPETLERQLFDVLSVLESAKVPYILTGAQARNLYAEPRTSMDYDVVVATWVSDPAELSRIFQDRGFHVEGPLKGNLGRRLVLALGEFEADIWLAPGTDLHRTEFERAVNVPYGDRTLPVMHPEDYVLRKLVNYQRIRGKTTDLEDAYQVLLYKWEDIDHERLINRAGFYRIEPLARRLMETVGDDKAKLEKGDRPGNL